MDDELDALLEAVAARIHAACEYVLDGTDTDETDWYQCVTHDELAPSAEAPCAGYYPPPYTDPSRPHPGH